MIDRTLAFDAGGFSGIGGIGVASSGAARIGRLLSQVSVGCDEVIR